MALVWTTMMFCIPFFLVCCLQSPIATQTTELCNDSQHLFLSTSFHNNKTNKKTKNNISNVFRNIE